MNAPDEARGHDDPFGIHIAVIGLAVVAGDTPAQRRGSQCRRIVDPAAVERSLRGHDRRFGRRGRRLSHFHVDDMAAGRFNACGSRHHIHHHERRNIAAPRYRQQAFCTVSQCRFRHRYLLFELVPKTSRIPRFGRAYRVSALPPIIKDRSMTFRPALRQKPSRFATVTTAIALALAPFSDVCTRERKRSGAAARY